MKRWRYWIPGLALAGIAAWQLGTGLWIPLKAAVGQALLEVPGLRIDQLVLAGMSGHSLAWGPGLIGPGEGNVPGGHTVIAGHRDTHFRFLRRLRAGDIAHLSRADGRWRRWEVIDMQVVDSRVTRLDLSAPGPLLTLVTCWPFDAVEAGGPHRYIVTLAPAGPERVAGHSPAKENHS